MGFINVTIVFLLICLAVSIFYIYREKHINKTKMSFKESLDLVGIPVVTLYQGNNKFNFLLDSGASNSCLNIKNLDLFEYEKCSKGAEVYGMEGNAVKVNMVNINLYYKNNKFETTLMVTDLNTAFSKVKQDFGVDITGILGTDFLSKYKYVLDFKDNIAYIK